MPTMRDARMLTPQEAFGEMLRRVRAHKGFSAEELASMSGVALSRIMRFESGMTEPTLSELFHLGDALGAQPGSLVDGADYLVEASRQRVLRRHAEHQTVHEETRI